ncbi:prostaglandin E receptor 2b subtype EP2 [Pygocentrus nattereri]|uniref:Prostaglandin E2 receptor EP2 subtype n=1 Tax=Pygocentrus nattereri TaxID=42514 RepID=A0A3B4EMI2_PYGNA|nr:prostaglandin E receptor 2b subtype EP2 [Pygocentrus nattereri]
MESSPDCEDLQVVHSRSPKTSAVMFSAGVLGNVVALVLLEVRRRRQKHSASLFQVLVTALVITDLLGTFSLSPLVISAYAQNRSLLGLSHSRAACNHFGFSMTFFSLVTLAVLLCMAVERWLAIGHPYLYERRVTVRCGYVVLPMVYLACALFCLAPLLGVGFGRYVQYCPGTWCFMDLNSTSGELGHKVYKNVYASCLLLMIACTVLCNASVSYHLVLMHRRSKANRSSFRRTNGQKSQSITEEVEHLVLLGFMTIAFVICSLPLVIRVYMSSKDHATDLTALLLLSMNPIIDPWVFIILSPPVPRLLWEKLCKASRSRSNHKKILHTQSETCPSNMTMELQK